jgi:hypothetical protein
MLHTCTGRPSCHLISTSVRRVRHVAFCRGVLLLVSLNRQNNANAREVMQENAYTNKTVLQYTCLHHRHRNQNPASQLGIHPRQPTSMETVVSPFCSRSPRIPCGIQSSVFGALASSSSHGHGSVCAPGHSFCLSQCN